MPTMAKKRPKPLPDPEPPDLAAVWTPDAIKAFRESKGWTRADLAWTLGVSARTVMYYETRGQVPALPVLKLLQLLSAQKKPE